MWFYSMLRIMENINVKNFKELLELLYLYILIRKFYSKIWFYLNYGKVMEYIKYLRDIFIK